MTSSQTKSELPILLVICGCLIAMMTFGPRSTMGFFQDPMLTMRGWDRTTFGLAMAIQNIIWGIGQPFFGAMSDRYGSYPVLVLSGLFYAAGLYLMSIAETATMLHMSGGVLIGLGIAAGSFSIIMAAFARNVPADKRTIVFGIGTAAGSAGMAFFAPLSVAMIAMMVSCRRRGLMLRTEGRRAAPSRLRAFAGRLESRPVSDYRSSARRTKRARRTNRHAISDHLSRRHTTVMPCCARQLRW